jgi:iron(II)-dependent oxidoreductase
MPEARRLAGGELAAALRDSRDRTLALVADLDGARWAVPEQAGVNPIAWELGHLAWFAEFWILRGPHRLGDDGFVDAARPARLAGPDALYDSARLGHGERWRHRWPGRAAVFATLQAQLEACVAALPGGDDDAALYWHRLALFHEDMHGEAFTWLRAALGWPAPDGLRLDAAGRRTSLPVAGGAVRIGRGLGEPGFAFDNEVDAHARVLEPFEIDAAPVDNAAYLAFVEAGGYAEPAFWPGAAGAWRAASRPAHPARWRRGDSGWEARWFDAWRPLAPGEPVVHVSAWEAEAWCRWAGRRLPSAVEWEHAAQSAPGFGWGGSVWEWTADPFRPHPGFRPGPYRDYSLPWFESHRELRGGSFATHARLHDVRYRNFFMPDRRDVFAGFRSARPRP